ncbi:hypothetical protein JCM3765_000431 [Sporobolomyces pararoseus]
MDEACSKSPAVLRRQSVSIHLKECPDSIGEMGTAFRCSYTTFETYEIIDPEVALAASAPSLRTLALSHYSNLKLDKFPDLEQLTLASYDEIEFWQLLEMFPTCSNLKKLSLDARLDAEFIPDLIRNVEKDYSLPPSLEVLSFGWIAGVKCQQLFAFVDKLPSGISLRNLNLDIAYDNFYEIHDDLDMRWKRDLEKVCKSQGIEYSEKTC